jgi:hypothetical protein
MRHFFFLPLLFVLVITGCKDKGKTVPTQLLVISNAKYFKAFPDGLERLKIVKKSLKGRFKISTLEMKNFENTEKELESFLKAKENEKKRFIVFVEPFLFPLIANSSSLSKFDLQVVSYGIGGNPSSSLSGLFHICISREYLFEQIKSLLEQDFKKNKKVPVILYDEQNGYSKGFSAWWNDNVKEDAEFAKLISYRQSSVSKDLTQALEEDDGRTFFLFAGVNNRAINTVNRDKFKNKHVVEIFTRYGMNNKCVSHYIEAEYNKLLKQGLKSEELKNFILTTDKKVVNLEMQVDFFKKKKNKEVKIVRHR